MKMNPVSTFSWQSYNEETASAYTEDTTTMDGLLEQINITRDTTDYLWYMTEWVFYSQWCSCLIWDTFQERSFCCGFSVIFFFLIFDIHSRVHIKPDEGFLKTGQYPVLTVMSAGHALHVFINGQLSGRCRVAFHGNEEDLLLNNLKLCPCLIIHLLTNSSVLWQELCMGNYQIQK